MVPRGLPVPGLSPAGYCIDGCACIIAALLVAGCLNKFYRGPWRHTLDVCLLGFGFNEIVVFLAPSYCIDGCACIIAALGVAGCLDKFYRWQFYSTRGNANAELKAKTTTVSVDSHETGSNSSAKPARSAMMTPPRLRKPIHPSDSASWFNRCCRCSLVYHCPLVLLVFLACFVGHAVADPPAVTLGLNFEYDYGDELGWCLATVIDVLGNSKYRLQFGDGWYDLFLRSSNYTDAWRLPRTESDSDAGSAAAAAAAAATAAAAAARGEQQLGGRAARQVLV